MQFSCKLTNIFRFPCLNETKVAYLHVRFATHAPVLKLGLWGMSPLCVFAASQFTDLLAKSKSSNTANLQYVRIQLLAANKL